MRHFFGTPCTILTLPVRRYLLPLWGVSRPPMISKTVDSTNLNFGRPLALSMRGRKNGGVDDLSLARFPWQLIDLLDQILLKND